MLQDSSVHPAPHSRCPRFDCDALAIYHPTRFIASKVWCKSVLHHGLGMLAQCGKQSGEGAEPSVAEICMPGKGTCHI